MICIDTTNQILTQTMPKLADAIAAAETSGCIIAASWLRSVPVSTSAADAESRFNMAIAHGAEIDILALMDEYYSLKR